MRLLLIFLAAVLTISFFGTPSLGGGWYWDLANGLGFVVFGGLLYLMLPTSGTRNVRIHERFGYMVVTLTLVHGFWLLLGDGAVVEYLRLDAPLYMWTGVIGLLGLFVLVLLSAMPVRARVHRSYAAFRHWHRALGIATVAFVLHHIVSSGFYLNNRAQLVLLVLTSALACFGRRLSWLHEKKPAGPGTLMGVAVVGTLVFATVRYLL